MAAYIPDRGHLVWINCNPQVGLEQGGRRPGVVLSPKSYNRPSGLALLCPITNHAKGYPFEVVLPDGSPIRGVGPADQLRSMDWRSREASFIATLEEPVMTEVTERIRALLGLTE